jgi:NADP-dependent 3-hydroxy acid dehydrogenase YdfG
MKRLIGKLAIVTGGSSGIGAACAEALAGEDAAVLATGRRVEHVDDGLEEG